MHNRRKPATTMINVIGVVGFRSRDLIFWEDKFREVCDEFVICTDDGSAGLKGLDIGPATAELIRQQAHRKCHPEQTLRSAQGILRLAADFSPARLESACERALTLHSYSYRAVRTLITAAPVTVSVAAALPVHDNVRGPDYYQ